MIKVVDTSGLLCPAPLIAMKRAINESNAGDEMVVWSDNEMSSCNLKAYLEELQIDFTQQKEEGKDLFRFVVPHSKATIDQQKDPEHCLVPSKGTDYVVVIKSDRMGEGEEALGKLLMRAFINSLGEADKLPSAILFYNSGIFVALEGSDTIEALKGLETRGVSMISCGTCLEFYQAKERLAVGVIGNMYKITEVVTKASSVVYP